MDYKDYNYYYCCISGFQLHMMSEGYCLYITMFPGKFCVLCYCHMTNMILCIRTVFMHFITTGPHKPSCFSASVFYYIPNDSRIMLYVYWITPWLWQFLVRLPDLLTCIFYFAWDSVLQYVAPHLWLSGFKEVEVCWYFMEWAQHLTDNALV